MKIIKNLTLAALEAIAVTLLFQTSITQAADQGPLRITFKNASSKTPTLRRALRRHCGW